MTFEHLNLELWQQ